MFWTAVTKLFQNLPIYILQRWEPTVSFSSRAMLLDAVLMIAFQVATVQVHWQALKSKSFIGT